MEKKSRMYENENPEKNSKKLILEVKNLVKVYNKSNIEVVALRGLNAKFYRGEIVLIEGPSGCGKTTLVNIIGGLDRATGGDIYYYEDDELPNRNNHGKACESKKSIRKLFDKQINVSDMYDHELENYRIKNVGTIFQFMNLIPSLTAIENVKLPLLFQDFPEEEQKSRALQLLRETNIDHRANHKPDQMSGGEQQRVAIACALINNPDIIIADEPTGNLDTKVAREIMDLFKSIIETHPNKTIIIVTHDRSVRNIADRILFIKDGVIIDEQTPDNGKISSEQLPEEVALEIADYQEKIITLESKLNQLHKIFKE